MMHVVDKIQSQLGLDPSELVHFAGQLVHRKSGVCHGINGAPHVGHGFRYADIMSCLIR